MWNGSAGRDAGHDRPRHTATCLTQKQWYHSVLVSRAHFLLSYSFVSLCLSSVFCLYLFLTDGTLKTKLIVLALILLPYYLIEGVKPQSLSLRSLELCGVVGRSALCGFGAAVSIQYGLLSGDDSTRLRRPAAFIFALTLFHFTEFVFTAISNPGSLSVHSFLIEQGPEYWIANAMSMLEYFFEELLVKNRHSPSLLQLSGGGGLRRVASLLTTPERLSTISFGLGILLVSLGEAVRKLAMFQAGASFFHLLYDRLGPDHRLVTDGLYGICRHPAYCGWFLWQLGMQLVLGTPVCLLTHCMVTVRFFSTRIAYEEVVLIRTFGRRYVDYMNKVKWTGVPFVRGAVVPPQPQVK